MFRLITARINIQNGSIVFSTPDMDTFKWVVLEIERRLSFLGEPIVVRDCYERLTVSGFKNDEDVVHCALWVEDLLFNDGWKVTISNKDTHERCYHKNIM